MDNLTHFDSKGNAIMVDVSEKSNTSRQAIAKGKIFMNPKTLTTIIEGKMSKGDVLGVARVAGIMASKQTHTLIPMCHPLMITKSTVDFQINEEKSYIEVIGTVRSLGQTGVEMEALTSVNIAALTIYDMCKAIDKEMVISEVYLHRKEGGKSGEVIYERFQD